MNDLNSTINERNFHISQLANKSIRALNFIIDSVVIFILNYLVLLNFGSINPINKSNETIYNPTFILIFLAYYIVFEYFTGKTIGKFITKTTVLTDGGLKPTFINIVGRSLSRIIPFEPISCMISDKAHGWHDSLSKTIVIPDSNL